MQDLRDVVPLAEAAARLEMSPEKLRELIHAGEVAARRQAKRWVVPVSEVRRLEGMPRPEGRPFSANAAWAMLAMIGGHSVDVSASRRSQLRRSLLDRDLDDLAGRLRRRASRQLTFAHPDRLVDLVDDERTVLTGWAGAEPAGASLLSGREESTEVYIHEADIDALRGDYGFIEPVEVANVVMRVVADRLRIPQQQGVAAAPVVGLDLLESGDPRGRQAGRAMFAEAVERFRDR